MAENLLPPALSSLVQGDLYGAAGDFGVVGALVQVAANKDYLGRDIEPSYITKLPSRERFKSETSKLAYGLGQITGWSPLKIDYFCSNMLGGFWKAQKALLPMEGKSDWSLTMGSRFVKDSLYSTDIVNMAYDLRDKLETTASGKAATTEDIIRAKFADKTVSFYGKYNSLAKAEPETTAARFTRQVVLDILNGTNGYLRGWGGSDSMDWVVKVIAESESMNAEKLPIPNFMSDTIKDVAGNERKLTAAQYVTYQEIYNTEYWKYVDILRQSGETENLYNALSVAKDAAQEYADSVMLATLDGRTPKADTRTESDMLESVLADAEKAAANDVYEQQRTNLYAAISSGDSSSAKKQINEMEKSGVEEENIRQTLNSHFKKQYQSAYLIGDAEACKNIERTLKSIGLKYKSTGKPYFSDEKFKQWRDDVKD